MAVIVFEYPGLLWLLVFLPIIVITHFISLRFHNRKAFNFANFEAIQRVTGKNLFSRNLSLLALRIIIVGLFIFAAAGTSAVYTSPGTVSSFVIAVDASSSMLATDIAPTRLDAVKGAAEGFIDALPPKTNIGLVVFSSTPFVIQVPTSDKEVLRSSLRAIQPQSVGGTDLGSTIITSSNLFPDTSAVVVLLTDGQSNVGIPVEAASIFAQRKAVIVHTIGIGTTEGGLYEKYNVTLHLDEESLRDISALTGGKYFRVQSIADLEEAYTEIAQVKHQRVKNNLTFEFLLLAIFLLLAEWGLLSTRYVTLP